MTDNTSALRDRLVHLSSSSLDRLPPHMRGKTYPSLTEALGEFAPSEEETDLRARLDSYRSLDRNVPSALELVNSVEPKNLQKEIDKAAAAHARNLYLGSGTNVQGVLDRALRDHRTSSDYFDHVVRSTQDTTTALVDELYDAADKLGEALLASTEHAIEANAEAVGRYGNAVARLTALSRQSVRNRNRDANTRIAVLIAPTFREAVPLELARDDKQEYTKILSDAATQQRHETTLLVYRAWRKGSGLLLAAVALGLLPEYEISVSNSWDEVQARHALMETAASKNFDAPVSPAISSTEEDNVTPAPNIDMG